MLCIFFRAFLYSASFTIDWSSRSHNCKLTFNILRCILVTMPANWSTLMALLGVSQLCHSSLTCVKSRVIWYKHIHLWFLTSFYSRSPSCSHWARSLGRAGSLLPCNQLCDCPIWRLSFIFRVFPAWHLFVFRAYRLSILSILCLLPSRLSHFFHVRTGPASVW